MIKKNYKNFIISGIILWIISMIFVAINLYPYLYFTIYPSPLLIFIGFLGWIKAYKENNGAFPNPFKSLIKSTSQFNGLFALHIGIIHFLFKHFLHWMTFWFLCLISMTFLMEIILKNTFHFKIASDFIQKDITLIPLAGKVKYFGMFPLVAVSSNGDGEIIFTIIGEKETVDATAIVENNQVISVEYK